MKISYAGLASITGAALLAACGSDVSNSSGSGAGGGSTSVTTTGGQTTGSTGTASTGSVASSNSSTGSFSSTSTGVGGGATGCPPALPSEGSPCTGAQIGLLCEYGDDPRPYCRDFASCDTFEGVEPTWVLKVVDCPPIAPVADCPTIPDSNDPCSTEGAICLYPDGAQCGCSSCGGGPCGMDPLWWCSKAPEVGCPTSAPNIGQPCNDAGLVCVYGTCAAATVMQRFCGAGIWQDEPVACPE